MSIPAQFGCTTSRFAVFRLSAIAFSSTVAPRSRRADRGGTFTLAYGVAGNRATNVTTPITVRARLPCGH